MITFLAYIFEVIIIGVFARRVYKNRFCFGIRLIFYLVLYGGMIVVHSTDHVFRNICLDIVASVIVFSVVFDSKVHMAIYNSLVLEAINFMSEILVGNIASHYIMGFWNEVSLDSNYFVFLFARVIFMTLALFLSSIQKRNSGKQKRTEVEETLITGIVVCALGFLVILSNIAFEVPYSTLVEKMIFYAVFDLMIVLILTMVLFRYNEKRSQDLMNMRLQIQKNEDNMLYFKSVEQKDEGLRILVHDIKNHLQSLSALNEYGENEKVADYIAGLLKRTNLNATVDISPNKLLNSIIYRYYSRALSENISFSYDVRNVNIGYIDDIDITSVICNLLDNAFEGCEGGNPFIDISIYSGNTPQSLVVSVVNSCLTKPRTNKVGHFISRKYEEIHGFGIESVKRTAIKYAGDVNIYYKPEDCTFHAVVLLSGDSNENSNL